jgi:hypothetical protein
MQGTSTSGATTHVDEMETIFERGQNEDWYLLVAGHLHNTDGDGPLSKPGLARSQHQLN